MSSIIKADDGVVSGITGITQTADTSGTLELQSINGLKLTSGSGVVDSSTSTGGFIPPSGTTAQRPASPAVGTSRWNTTNEAYEIWNGVSWYTVTQTSVSLNLDYLIIAGGGGGSSGNGGGGGGGGYLTGNTTITNSFTLSVGAGGAIDTAGSDSYISTITAAGGGKGGGTTGLNGGSGGGAGGAYTSVAGGSAVSGQGYNGGSQTPGASSGCMNYAGGGGGGASAVGGNSYSDPCNNTSYAGNGGSGATSSITGSATVYAGGGGGGNENNSRPKGSGGSGGGGNGGSSNGSPGTNGTTNLGGGGGGRNGVGGSGVVVIRYLDTLNDLSNISSGLAYTQTTLGGYKIYKFTAGIGTVTI